MTINYPWYSIVDSPELEQGDLLHNCPVLEPNWNAEDIPNEEQEFLLTANQLIFSVVVLTQSCDLVNNKVDTVLVCPFAPVEEFIDYNYPNWNERERGRFKEEVRRGYRHGYHLIAACGVPEFTHDIQIVDFYKIFNVPKSMLVTLATYQSPRIRLMPPYREHLGQAFARFFMRVGLPIDIPNQK